MSRRIWLTLTIAEFALLVLVADFASVLLRRSFGPMPLLKGHWRFEFLVGALWFVPIAAASYGIFLQLLKKFSRRESRGIATVFGLTRQLHSAWDFCSRRSWVISLAQWPLPSCLRLLSKSPFVRWP